MCMSYYSAKKICVWVTQRVKYKHLLDIDTLKVSESTCFLEIKNINKHFTHKSRVPLINTIVYKELSL